MMSDTHERRRAFCARFKDERERRDRSLLAIAGATKVQVSLLEAFERADVSKWPKGIYRRAFFRDYVTAIGLPAHPHVADFIELFPDSDDTAIASGALPGPTNGSVPASPLRIMLAETSPEYTVRSRRGTQFGSRPTVRHTAAAVTDLLGIALLALPISWGLASFWQAIAIVACTYYPLCTILLGRSLGSALLARWTSTSIVRADIKTIVAPGLRWTRRRAPAVKGFVEHTLRNRSAWGESLSQLFRTSWIVVRSTLSRLAYTVTATRGQRQRDLAALRRRRVEAAERSNDEISEVMG